MQFDPIQLPSLPTMLAAYEAGGEHRLRQLQAKRDEESRSALRDVFSPAGVEGPYGLKVGGGVRSALGRAYGGTPNSPIWAGPETTGQDGGDPYSGRLWASPQVRAAVKSGNAPAAPLTINREALARLGQINPELALRIGEMDARQRETSLQALERQLTVAGRVTAAVMQAPPERQNEVYQNYRHMVEREGVTDLPDVWDPELARSRMQTGMTVAEALGADRADRRLGWDITDDQADNAETQRYHDAEIGVRRRGQDINSGDRRRGQDIGHQDRVSDPRRVPPGTNRVPTPNTVIGAIMQKQASGQPITPQEQQVLREYQAGRGRGHAGAGRAGQAATILNHRTGQRMVLQGDQWVPAP
jgi:hypothetical protein